MLSLRYERMSAGFEKWHVDGLPIAMAYHHFTAADDHCAHDHPMAIRVRVLAGGYVEEIYEAGDRLHLRSTVTRRAGDSFVIPAERIHRIVELPDGECWTCCLYGPWERETRFWRDDFGRIESRVWNETEWRAA